MPSISNAAPFRRTSSIKTRTLVTIAVIMSLIVGIADQIELWRNQSERARGLETRGSLVGSIQADALAQPVWDLANDQVQSILAALERDPDFLSAEVTGVNKKQIATQGKLAVTSGFVEKQFDIMHGAAGTRKQIGQLVLRLSTQGVELAGMQEFRVALVRLTLTLAIIMGAIYAALRMITTPLSRMTEVMSQLAEGNTEVEVPATRRSDEIGAMAHAVDVFKINAIARSRLENEQVELKRQSDDERRETTNALASDFEGTVKGIVRTVSDAGKELEQTARALAKNAESVGNQVAAVIRASDQATVNVQTVAAAAEELSTSIGEIGTQVTQSANIASQAVEEADRTNLSVESLADAARRIGDVVALINSIASQTNLLALNATIEAARAGEAGNGFAVVASEVKNLANQTAKATEEISAQVMAIQGATTSSVEAIKGISKTIAQIDEIATGIAAAVKQQSAATQQIARNVQAAADGTREVSANIGGVGEAVCQTGLAAGIVRDATTTLGQQFGHLNDQVEGFLHRIRVG